MRHANFLQRCFETAATAKTSLFELQHKKAIGSEAGSKCVLQINMSLLTEFGSEVLNKALNILEKKEV